MIRAFCILALGSMVGCRSRECTDITLPLPNAPTASFPLTVVNKGLTNQYIHPQEGRAINGVTSGLVLRPSVTAVVFTDGANYFAFLEDKK